MARATTKRLAGIYVFDDRRAEIQGALPAVKNVDRVISSAINKTLTSVKKKIETGLIGYLAIEKSSLAKRLYIKKAKADGRSGAISIYARPFALINFSATDTGRNADGTRKPGGTGVNAEVERGSPFNLPHAFIVRTKVRGLQVFQRTVIGPGSVRKQITTQRSQRLIDLFRKSPIGQSIDSVVSTELNHQIDVEIDRLLYK